MDSVTNTNNDAHFTTKSSSTKPAPSDTLNTVRSVLEEIDLLQQKVDGVNVKEHIDLQLLASGGFNDIWLISRPLEDVKRYVLRVLKEDALLPDQVRNEVACLTFVKQNLRNVPVPQVYSYSLEESSCQKPFVAEEYIEGHCLSSVWMTYEESTKMAVSYQFAEILVQLAETTFDGIGGLMLDHRLGPTVEGMKVFKGRVSVFGGKCSVFPVLTLAEQISFPKLLQHWPVQVNKRVCNRMLRKRDPILPPCV